MSYFDFRKAKFFDDDGNELPRTQLLQFDDVTITHDAANNRLVFAGASAGGLTFVETVGETFEAEYGQHVLVLIGEAPQITLPPAEDAVAGANQVAVTVMTEATVEAGAGDSIPNAENEPLPMVVNQTLVFQSDGVNTWWIVGSYTPPA